MGLDNGNVLLLSPLVFLDVRVQVVVPSFSALFANPSGQRLGYVTPIFCAKLFDIISEPVILVLAPGPFDHGGIQYFLPPVQALDVGSLIKERGNSLPVPGPVFLNQLSQLIVLLSVPISFRVLWILRKFNLILLAERERMLGLWVWKLREIGRIVLSGQIQGSFELGHLTFFFRLSFVILV